jgi:hypothetical protein
MQQLWNSINAVRQDRGYDATNLNTTFTNTPAEQLLGTMQIIKQTLLVGQWFQYFHTMRL